MPPGSILPGAIRSEAAAGDGRETRAPARRIVKRRVPSRIVGRGMRGSGRSAFGDFRHASVPGSADSPAMAPSTPSNR